MEIAGSMLELVGNTPLVKFNRIFAECKGTVAGKVEEFNPSGSVKDRIALHMVRQAEKEGKLKPGGTIVESSSGNTASAVALAGLVLGYKVIIAVIDKVSPEKLNYLKALGAEVVVCPYDVQRDDPQHYLCAGRRIADETPGGCYLGQNDNPANSMAHYELTGPEIWHQTDGRVTCFVAGIGTGGTLSGTGKYLREQNPGIKVIAVEPEGSIFRETMERGSPEGLCGSSYKVEGIGEAEVIPKNLDFSLCDEIVKVTDRECFLTARRMAREEGIVAGGSAGGAVAAGLKIADRLGEADIMVIILPDGGDRYINRFYNDAWMLENKFLPE